MFEHMFESVKHLSNARTPAATGPSQWAILVIRLEVTVTRERL